MRSGLFGLLAVGLLACGSESLDDDDQKAAPDPESGPGRLPGPSRPLKALPSGSFNVTAKLELEAPEAGDSSANESCLAFDFTSQLYPSDEPNDEGWQLSPAVNGAFASVLLEPGVTSFDASPMEAEGASVLDIPAGHCCETLSLRELHVVADGSGFRATGQGELTDESCGSDVLHSSRVRVELTGAIDELAPSVVLPDAPLHPLVPTTVLADEPLAGSSRAELELSTGRFVELEATRQQAPFWGFEVPPLLAFDVMGEWRAEAEDLGGNARLSRGQLLTLSAPDFLTQDGFESEVASVGTPVTLSFDAITGARALRIEEEDVVTFRLETNGGTVLRFNARQLISGAEFSLEETDNQTVRYRVGVEGGSRVVERQLSPRFPEGDPLGYPLPDAVEVPLADAGEAVIVMFDMPPFDEECGLVLCYGVPALIDDLRIE